MILIDTAVLIEIVDRASEKGKIAFEKLLGSGADYCTSSVCFYEFVYGCFKNAESYDKLEIIPNVVSFTKSDALLSAFIRDASEKDGNAVPKLDAMIAAVAINNNCELYTFDKHFDYVQKLGLKLFG